MSFWHLKYSAYIFGIALFSALLLSPISLKAKTASDVLVNVPIKEFVLPFFDTNGHKSWEASGELAVMNTDGYFDVENVQLFCFEEAPNSSIKQFHAVSSNAEIIPDMHRASGKSKIKIFGEKFSASANNWDFFGDLKKIVAKDNVKVLLEGDLTEFSQ